MATILPNRHAVGQCGHWCGGPWISRCDGRPLTSPDHRSCRRRTSAQGSTLFTTSKMNLVMWPVLGQIGQYIWPKVISGKE